MLRQDDETGFLACSLPDAVADSLARFDSLVVRSSPVAARFEGQADPARIGAEAQVNAILIGFRAYRRLGNWPVPEPRV